ncbi:hypothetical protein B4088_2995 [Bacillus cereus]|uniref:Uncharacterized protein n=1 Tax=Bacillus cereus TaxID=1396 RepID=A0A164NPN0_BACCE|nr:hypothetical protein B4088_2995 [Bacillus cereus]
MEGDIIRLISFFLMYVSIHLFVPLVLNEVTDYLYELEKQ